MPDVAGRQKLSRRNGPHRRANQNAVHDDFIARSYVGGSKFVLRRDIGLERVRPASERDHFVLLQVGESDQDVVMRVELKDAGVHGRSCRMLQDSGDCKRSRNCPQFCAAGGRKQPATSSSSLQMPELLCSAA